ncbi:hypothetical protein TNCV_812111 [Trichonephila clavipes]|nr:hypothetical protein TNCV_812111 [Trichonephila clavipes]
MSGKKRIKLKNEFRARHPKRSSFVVDPSCWSLPLNGRPLADKNFTTETTLGCVHNTSLLIGRSQNSPTTSLESYSHGTHNHTLCLVWNVLAPDFSFDIWTFCSSHSLCSLEPFSNHLPRRQCSPLDRLRLLSMGAGTPMSIMISVRVSSWIQGQTINNDP